MIAWDGDHGRDSRQHDQRIMRPLRRELVKGAVEATFGIWLGKQQAALAEIIEGQRRQRHAEPGDADRQRAEMAHVGVKGLPAGHGQKRPADDDEGQRPGMPKIGDGRQRIKSSEHLLVPCTIADDAEQAGDR